MKPAKILATLVLATAPLTAFAEGDPAAGEKSFRKCMACHQVGEAAKNKVGPVLNGVIGRTAGTAPDFAYSDVLTEQGAGGLVWTAETLDHFIENPKKAMPGTKMSFPGIKKPEERANIVAYLTTLSEGAVQEAEGAATIPPEVDG